MDTFEYRLLRELEYRKTILKYFGEDKEIIISTSTDPNLIPRVTRQPPSQAVFSIGQSAILGTSFGDYF